MKVVSWGCGKAKSRGTGRVFHFLEESRNAINKLSGLCYSSDISKFRSYFAEFKGIYYNCAT